MDRSNNDNDQILPIFKIQEKFYASLETEKLTFFFQINGLGKSDLVYSSFGSIKMPYFENFDT